MNILSTGTSKVVLNGVPEKTIHRRRGVRTGSRRGIIPHTHNKLHGLRLQRWPSPQDEALRDTTLLGVESSSLVLVN